MGLAFRSTVWRGKYTKQHSQIDLSFQTYEAWKGKDQ